MDHASTDCSPASSPSAQSSQFIAVSRCDRWQVHHRLQELDISCACPEADGLQVEITSPIVAMQLRSVLLQFTASRNELAAWLEQCWKRSA